MTMVHIRLRAPTNGGTRAGVGKPGDIYLDLDTMDLYTNNQERN